MKIYLSMIYILTFNSNNPKQYHFLSFVEQDKASTFWYLNNAYKILYISLSNQVLDIKIVDSYALFSLFA